MNRTPRSARDAIVVRGIGDVASAVAHGLFLAGLPVVVHDVPAPLTTRRRMAFADAMFDGQARLAGVGARRADSLDALERLLAAGRELPATSLDLHGLLGWLRPRVLIDARMRKRAEPEDQRALAPLVIGLGPNFVAGANVHLAVETEWGERLGVVLDRGATAPLRGEPRTLAGHGRERFVYAARDGCFRTHACIGARVTAGAAVGRLDAEAVAAPLTGWVRGLVRDGLQVPAGTRLLEIDPRLDAPELTGLGRRPQRIANAVLAAIDARLMSG